jgi:NitT/TauT family transport system substrate-binding protein
MIAHHKDLLKHFASAYEHGVQDYRDAFLRLDAQGRPIVDATTEAAIPLLTKYIFTNDPEGRRKILDGVGYYDPNGALDVKDVIAQIKWFKDQGLVKGDTDPAAMLDNQFLPTR